MITLVSPNINKRIKSPRSVTRLEAIISKRHQQEAEIQDLHDEIKRLEQIIRENDNIIKALPLDIDFSDSSGSVWYVLNKKYKGSGSREYENSWDAKDDVDGSISYIRENAVKPEATFATKQSALETLRKIGKSLVLGPSTLGHEVRKQFQRDDRLEAAMLEILNGLRIEERKKIASAEDSKGRFVDKVDELWKMADGLYVLNEMKEVWTALQTALDAQPGESEAIEAAEGKQSVGEASNKDGGDTDDFNQSSDDLEEVFEDEEDDADGDEDNEGDKEVNADVGVVAPGTTAAKAISVEEEDDDSKRATRKAVNAATTTRQPAPREGITT